MKIHSLMLLFCLCPAALPAEEEEVLPTGFPVSRYTAIWEDSPFNREVVKVAAQTIQSSFAQTLVLEGIVNDDTIGPIAYVRDVAEDRPLVITNAASEAHPYTIVTANQTNNPEETKITLTDGKETGEIGYVVTKLTQAIAQPAVAAQPNRPPNQPGRDGKPGAAGASSMPPPVGAGGGQSGGGRVPGSANPIITSDEPPAPKSAAPALDNMDSEPRRRRVPLPGG